MSTTDVLAPMPPMPKRSRRPKAPASRTITHILLGVLGVVSLVLSGWSLGTLLHDRAGAPWWAACLGVGVFDLPALVAAIQVYERRYAPHTAGGARLVMMLTLLASSVVNGAHGLALGGWTTAVVLAAAPLAFETCFELTHRTLTVLIWVLFRREAGEALRRDAWARIAPATIAAPVVGIERVSAGDGAGGRPETAPQQVSVSPQVPASLPESASQSEIEPVRVPEQGRVSTAAAVRQAVAAEGIAIPAEVMVRVSELTGRPAVEATVKREIRSVKAAAMGTKHSFGFGRN